MKAPTTRLFSVVPPADATPDVLPVWAPDDSVLDYVVTRAAVSNIWPQPLTGGAPSQLHDSPRTRFQLRLVA